MGKSEIKLTPEQKKERFLAQRFLTVMGWFTVSELIKKFGNPKAVIEIARVELKTKKTGKPTVVAKRKVDVKLVFRRDIVLSSVPEYILNQIELSGTEEVIIRHPKYSPEKMPMATAKEMEG